MWDVVDAIEIDGSLLRFVIGSTHVTKQSFAGLKNLLMVLVDSLQQWIS